MAKAVAYLVQADYVAASILAVDGGITVAAVVRVVTQSEGGPESL